MFPTAPVSTQPPYSNASGGPELSRNRPLTQAEIIQAAPAAARAAILGRKEANATWQEYQRTGKREKLEEFKSRTQDILQKSQDTLAWGRELPSTEPESITFIRVVTELVNEAKKALIIYENEVERCQQSNPEASPEDIPPDSSSPEKITDANITAANPPAVSPIPATEPKDTRVAPPETDHENRLVKTGQLAASLPPPRNAAGAGIIRARHPGNVDGTLRNVSEALTQAARRTAKKNTPLSTVAKAVVKSARTDKTLAQQRNPAATIANGTGEIVKGAGNIAKKNWHKVVNAVGLLSKSKAHTNETIGELDDHIGLRGNDEHNPIFVECSVLARVSDSVLGEIERGQISNARDSKGRIWVTLPYCTDAIKIVIQHVKNGQRYTEKELDATADLREFLKLTVQGEKAFENGHTYWGAFLGAARDGFGILKDEAGNTVYEGYWRGDQRNGRGTAYWQDTSHYEGEWKNNKRHGQGNFKSAEGDSYSGNWFDDMMHGKDATYVHASGGSYEGDFEAGKPHGKGKRIYSDGSSYVGDWREGNRHGFGKLTYSKASLNKCYDGQWQNDKRHGEGVLTFVAYEGNLYAIQCTYMGAWVNDKRHGQGTQTGDGVEYSGEWYDDKRQGQGEGVWRALGSHGYNGRWKDNQPNGEGTLTFDSCNRFWRNMSSTYTGEVQKGCAHGFGVRKWKDGKKESGIWKDGKLMKRCKKALG